ncbi:MAG: methionyl-tRNA formyltransferase [Spirochaetes bacterium]|nr:methionyl-tRNA formyltransferase [Spirochaetota bacterium]
MKIFFAGTPEIAVKSLEKIADAGAGKFNICGVLTNPDRPQGRNNKIVFSPVKKAALALNLPLYQPETIDSNFISAIKSLNPDILVTFAYGKIFKKEFLSIFAKETLNIHPSLLPKYRGPSPITAAILAGDSETGITIQKMALKMDSGDIVKQIKFPLTGKESASSLEEDVAEKSALLITEVLADIAAGNSSSMPQDHSLASYCSFVKKEDGLINWNEKTVQIERKFRAYRPWPGIFTYWKEKLIAITECYAAPESPDAIHQNILPGTVAFADKNKGIFIKTADSFLVVTKLKPQSKNEMDFKSFLNGSKDFIGSVF